MAPSSDSKPRLKWTRQLHERFVDAIMQLGGAEKATPKMVMLLMGVPGVTLYHLKSHLQKYRLAKNRESNTIRVFGNQGCKVNNEVKAENETFEVNESRSELHINESMLQIQMEVQKKLEEQTEVQRHLQLRIEAQGKYLQSVLKKAQETLAGYTSSCIRMEDAKAELSELVSAVDTECFSCLTSSEKTDKLDNKAEQSLSPSQNLSEDSDVFSRNHAKRICKQEHSSANLVELDLNR